MKRLILVLLMCIVFAGTALGATLTWDAPATGNFDGYTIKWGSVQGEYPYSKMIPKDVTSLEDIENVLNLEPGVKYWFAITAYNSANVSPDSNVVTYNREVYIPPGDVLPIEINVPSKITITIDIE